MQILDGVAPRNARIAIYGEPKKGKTRLATSLPWGEGWGDRAVYVAWDSGAEELASVLPENRKHLTIIKPTTKLVKSPKGDRWEMDPLTEAVEIATHDWAGHQTIIWDTMTQTSRDMLTAISGIQMHGKTPAYGTPGTDAYVPQPAMGDYGAAQRSTMHILGFLFNQPMNVIVIFHSADDSDGGATDTIGGPATVGRAAIRPISAMFDDLYRVTSDRKPIPGRIPPEYVTKRIVQTEANNYWLAGMRSPHKTNPMPEYNLTDNPVQFWLDRDQVLYQGDR